MAVKEPRCDACGVNAAQVAVGTDARYGLASEYKWSVCFLCVGEFVKETDATYEAFDWWIEKERGNDERAGNRCVRSDSGD